MTDLIHNALQTIRRDVVYIHPENSVKESINLMIEKDIGALVVVNKDNQLMGMVSERDIVRSCLNQGISLETATVADIVYRDMTILSPNDPIEEAMQAMTATKRRHILIRDEHNKLAILSIGDLLFHLLEDKARVIEQLENYIHTY